VILNLIINDKGVDISMTKYSEQMKKTKAELESEIIEYLNDHKYDMFKIDILKNNREGNNDE
jgi:hypothetical protein